jgi:NTP pyrophosphatase (non-canonical NTP hydrolase)
MSLEELQKEVDAWIKKTPDGYWPWNKMLEKLGEEYAEVSKALSELYDAQGNRISDNTEDLAQELADVLFPIICIANIHGISLDEAWKKKMKKRYEKAYPANE